MKPLISIILPVYNNGKYLTKCIDSILNQSYTNFELIIINDGSTDSSGKIIDEFSQIDNRIIVFSQENLGVSIARNVGLKNASGEWITFCDSDDWVDENWLENYITNISNGDEIVIQGFKSIGWPTGETEIGVSKPFGNKQEFIVLMNEINVVGYTWCKLFKREIIEKYSIYFDGTIRVLEDEIFVLQYFSKIEKINNISNGYYNYVYPDYHNKYLKKRNIDYALALSKYARIIFGRENYSNPLIIRYYHMAIGNLFMHYKSHSQNNKDLMVTFTTFFFDEIPKIKYNRPLFKPLRLIINRNHPGISSLLLLVYCRLLNLLNK